jgi:hypothetical protein
MVLMAALYMAASATFAAPQEEQETAFNSRARTRVEIKVAYYECVSPAACKCVAATQEEKDQCPECSKWSKVYLPSSAEFLDMNAHYSQDEFFLADATREIYGRGSSAGKESESIFVSDFYNNYGSYGWVEVGKDFASSGALVLWPDRGGLLMGGGEASGGTPPQILVCSPKPGGGCSVTQIDLAKIEDAGEPRYVIRKELLEKVKAVQPKKDVD